MKNKEKGFTLVELVITIVIVAILSIVSVTAYEVQVEMSRASEVYSIVNAIADAQELYCVENGRCTNNIQDLGLGIPGEETTSISYSVINPGNIVSIKTQNFAYATWEGSTTSEVWSGGERISSTKSYFPYIAFTRINCKNSSNGTFYTGTLKVNKPSKTGKSKRFTRQGMSWNKTNIVKNIVFSKILKKFCEEDVSATLLAQ